MMMTVSISNESNVKQLVWIESFELKNEQFSGDRAITDSPVKLYYIGDGVRGWFRFRTNMEIGYIEIQPKSKYTIVLPEKVFMVGFSSSHSIAHPLGYQWTQ